MYEQNDVPVFRRILWLALWFVVILVVLWVAVWLIFFRHADTKKVATPHKTTTTTQQQKSSGTVATPDSADSSTSSGNPSSGATVPTASPAELANTGPGDVVTPVAVAAVAGSALYYIRTRKKLLA